MHLCVRLPRLAFQARGSWNKEHHVCHHSSRAWCRSHCSTSSRHWRSYPALDITGHPSKLKGSTSWPEGKESTQSSNGSSPSISSSTASPGLSTVIFFASVWSYRLWHCKCLLCAQEEESLQDNDEWWRQIQGHGKPGRYITNGQRSANSSHTLRLLPV